MVKMEWPQYKIAFITNHHHVILNTLKATVNVDYDRDNGVSKERQSRNGTKHMQFIMPYQRLIEGLK